MTTNLEGTTHPITKEDPKWFKPIPGNSNYTVSRLQEFKDSNNQTVTLPSAGNNLVRITLYGTDVSVCPKWLSLISHFELNLPDPSFSKLLNVKFVPYKIDPIFGNYIGVLPMFKRPVEILHNGKIYRVVASYCGIAVSCDGCVIKTHSHKELFSHTKVNQTDSDDYYRNIHLYNPDRGERRNVSIHRLVSLAWLKFDDSEYLSKYMVNHKDGVKSNNHASNLEWCTGYHNSIHAVEAGLRGDNIKCRVRDFTTGEVHNFASKARAAEFMGVNKTHMVILTDNAREGALIKDRYEFKQEGDDSPWLYENREDIVQKNRYELKITYPDGKVKYIYTREDAREILNQPKVRNILDIAAAAKLADPSLKIEVIDHYKRTAVQCLNHSTGEIVEEVSVKGMARLININVGVVISCMKKGPMCVHSGFSFRPKSDLPWVGDFVKIDEGRGQGITATHMTTGEVLNFSSARAAAKVLGVRIREKLREALNGQCEFKEWRVVNNTVN